MDFAIAPLGGEEPAWEVLCLREAPGGERAVPLATFGHRGHAEAFLADLIAMTDDAPPGGAARAE